LCLFKKYILSRSTQVQFEGEKERRQLENVGKIIISYNEKEMIV